MTLEEMPRLYGLRLLAVGGECIFPRREPKEPACWLLATNRHLHLPRCVVLLAFQVVKRSYTVRSVLACSWAPGTSSTGWRGERTD